MQRRNILKDTIQLTAVQFFLECISLLLNVWLTRRIGTATVGIVALTSSFFQLAATAANGNGFLCTSRFVSEELGKPHGNPNRVLGYAIFFCQLLGIPVSLLIFCFAEPLSLRFLKSAELALPVRMFACILPIGGICACLKGYLNATCRITYAAICDVIECLSRCAVLMLLLQRQAVHTNASICMAMAYSTGISTIFSFIFLLWSCWKSRISKTGTVSISLHNYIHLAIPVLFGGCLTAALSSANDALIPITLRQAGNSTETAFSQFGIWEGIVIPVLFFPSTILCALSGILLTEAARATAAGHTTRLQQLTTTTIQRTTQLSVLITAGLLVYGNLIGNLLDGGDFAGYLIRLLAPVVPFIYLEIVLEALLKGMGQQAFSSTNYLVEYTIRIAIVLICIPKMGFYGIVLSYYASNLFGNCSRLRKVCRTANVPFMPWQMCGLPIFAAAFAFQIPLLCLHLCHAKNQNWIWLCLLPAILLYLLLLRLFAMRHSTISANVQSVNCRMADGASSS